MYLRIAIGAAAVIAAGCGDDVTVANVAGGPSLGTRYTLTSIEGQPLPAPYAQNRLSAERVRAGALTLGPGTRGQWTLTVDGANGRPRQEDAGLSWALQGDRVTVSLDCPALASCVAPPHLFGRVMEWGIVFDSSRVTRAPLVFTRTQ
jgi:hypothetical protein